MKGPTGDAEYISDADTLIEASKITKALIKEIYDTCIATGHEYFRDPERMQTYYKPENNKWNNYLDAYYILPEEDTHDLVFVLIATYCDDVVYAVREGLESRILFTSPNSVDLG